MEFIKSRSIIVFVALVLLCFCASSANAQRSPPAPVSPTPAPAPAPEREHVNITYLLSYAGPFHTFLGYLQSTKVLETFQNQADNTEEGLTLFVPKDEAFKALKKPYPSLSNLTQDQLKSFCLFHALPHYYPLSYFGKLSQNNPIQSFAGNAYSLNMTENFGTIHVDSGWTKARVISAVHAADPVAIYETDKVLLPEAIFGTDIPPPPPPAPAPAPEIAPTGVADGPADQKGKGATSSPAASSSHRTSIISSTAAAAAAAIAIMFAIATV
ncbi:fasciclin-like arabinogalactan protein 7 [Andrographis paniculata]|uniref:fasciclin-like arabinogalactan protein 7 n=1 Tax=Andrographis paniculata TaxID=175694 RepID=UPI0021E8468F|nr:fasciclin-like arabinogalactan protein 7 [Andrographis paniculata]